MTDDTKIADDVNTTVEPGAAARKRGRRSNGKSGPSDVPSAKARVISSPAPGPDPEPQPELAGPSDPMSTQLILTVDGQESPDGNQANQANQSSSQLAGRLAR